MLNPPLKINVRANIQNAVNAVKLLVPIRAIWIFYLTALTAGGYRIGMKKITVRNVPEKLIGLLRIIAAKKSASTNKYVSLNTLFIDALKEYVVKYQ